MTLGADIANILLRSYRHAPFHPGKGNVVAALSRAAGSRWQGRECVKRRGILYELDRRDLVEREIYYDTYEPWETLLVERILHPNWVCFDVGANVGYFSLLFSRLEAIVHAFEPSPANLQRLRRNIELNPSFKIAVHALALSDYRGREKFTTAVENAGASYLGGSGTEVDVATLDWFVSGSDITRLDFIKVDIEGCEAKFLEGAETTIARFHPKLLLELNPRALSQFGSSVEDIARFLSRHGYKTRRIHWRRYKTWEPPAPGNYFNIIAEVS
jgi:FkbM family methyltransferase